MFISMARRVKLYIAAKANPLRNLYAQCHTKFFSGSFVCQWPKYMTLCKTLAS